MMTSAQVVETSVTNTDNSPSQDYTRPDDQTTLLQIIIMMITIFIEEAPVTLRGFQGGPH